MSGTGYKLSRVGVPAKKLKLKIDTRVFNDKYFPYLKAIEFVQIFFGGSSSGKSWFAAQRAVLDVLNGKRNYLVIRKTEKSLRGSFYNQVIKAIKAFKLEAYFNIPKTTMTITCNLNNYCFMFSGCDDVSKVKSIVPVKDVITDILVEEATEIEYNDFKQLTKRLRGGRVDIKKRLTLLFNPILKTHWIYKEFFYAYDEDKGFYKNPGKLLIVHSTYKDNKFLQPEEIYDLEHEKDKYHYNVYTLGKWGIIGYIIYKDWKRCDLSDIVKRFEGKVIAAIDWGFSKDPACYIKTYYHKSSNTFYCWDEVYSPGLLNKDLAEELRPLYKGELIVADCREPKDIKEFRQWGFSIMGSKDEGINTGIHWLQGVKIVIDIKCVNLERELTMYHWIVDKDGNPTRQAYDRENHLMDCIRYASQIHRKGGWATL